MIMLISVDIPWHADSSKSQRQWQLLWPIRVNQPELRAIRQKVCPPATVCNYITAHRIVRISALDDPKVKRKSMLGSYSLIKRGRQIGKRVSDCSHVSTTTLKFG